jgi:peroxiredoxin/DNA-binding transcriptional MerR regulator
VLSKEIGGSVQISEVAMAAGVSPKAVRYYEMLGLVTPTRRENGYRDYDDHEVRVVRELGSLARLGIPLTRARPFIDCLNAGGTHVDDCPASMAEYQSTIDSLDDQIRELSERREALERQLRRAASRGDSSRRWGGRPVTELTVLPDNLPVPDDDGGAAHLPGAPMPGLTLPATAGSTVRLDALGRGRTVIYIYPLTGRPEADLPRGWDSIPGARGCTPEACGFRDHHAELLRAGASRVLGLSSQDAGYQREVVERLRLPYQLLSDPEHELADRMGLPTFEVDGQRLYRRLTLVVCRGLVEHVFYPVFPPDKHAQEVLAWFEEQASPTSGAGS